MAIKRKDRGQFQPMHHGKRETIGEGKPLVVIALKERPALLEQVVFDVVQIYRGAGEEILADLQRFRMVVAAVKRSRSG
ncbi:MAG: hypothetical protein U0236_10685 [Nitrospira sp.]